ncbi:ATP-binding protein [Arthrobacter sp. NPDC089319]|uniref:sensor histidine kinase n=1 Tax=Arthrobacter sp. NPDC089319 TaxID=3155915 RepID=UPI00342F899C
MDKVLDLFTLNRVKFHALSLRGRVVMSQLPLSITMLFLCVGTWILYPPLVWDPQFGLSMVLNAVLLAACFLVPWDKLPYPSFLLIPLLDFVPIALLREGTGSVLTGVGLLAAFPVIWLAASGQFPRLSVIAGALASLAMVWIPVFLEDSAVTLKALTHPLLVPFMMLAIGITVRVMTASMMEQQRVVEAKDAELRTLLEASGRRERLLSAVMSAVDVGVLAVDEEGSPILRNRRQEELRRLALPPGDEDAPESRLELYSDGGSTVMPVQDRPIRRAVRGESFSEYLMWMGRKPGQRVLSTSAQAMCDDSGRREGTVLAFSDVTELVAAVEAKNDFLSSVSHELRTPLTSIQGYAELLAMTPDLSPNMASGLDTILRNSDQLLTLVKDLLGTAAGFSELQPVQADLAEIAAQAVAAAEPRAAAGGVALTARAQGDLGVVCDPARVRQVLDNLVSNAIKYSPQGGDVTVSCTGGGGVVECRVADQGMGMGPDEIRNVFTRFFRSPAARRSSIPGLGLGLALSKDIVERHGGSMSCESEPGAGSVFTFSLPMAGPPRENEADGASNRVVPVGAQPKP